MSNNCDDVDGGDDDLGDDKDDDDDDVDGNDDDYDDDKDDTWPVFHETGCSWNWEWRR